MGCWLREVSAKPGDSVRHAVSDVANHVKQVESNHPHCLPVVWHQKHRTSGRVSTVSRYPQGRV